MVTITLKGREIPLLYTTQEMLTIQQEIAPIADAISLAIGRNPEDDDDRSKYMGAEHLEALAKMIRILGNAALDEAGENADLTDKKILRAIKPAEIPEAINKCMAAMPEGMASEIPEKEDDGPVDVVLEEMKKKKEKES